MRTMMDDGERQVLAREVAADISNHGYKWIEAHCPECDEDFEVEVSVRREVFIEGWDAAMNYIKERNDKTKLVESQGAG